MTDQTSVRISIPDLRSTLSQLFNTSVGSTVIIGSNVVPQYILLGKKYGGHGPLFRWPWKPGNVRRHVFHFIFELMKLPKRNSHFYCKTDVVGTSIK